MRLMPNMMIANHMAALLFTGVTDITFVMTAPWIIFANSWQTVRSYNRRRAQLG